MREKKTVLKFFAKEKTRKCVQPHAHETHVPLKPTRDASSRNKWRSGVLCVGIPVPARLELELRPGPVFRPLQNHAPKKVIHTSEASFTSPLDSSRVGTRDCRPSLSLFPKDSWRLSRDRLACTVTIATRSAVPHRSGTAAAGVTVVVSFPSTVLESAATAVAAAGGEMRTNSGK